MITKTGFDAKLSSLNRKITQNKTKHLLVENELNQLKTLDSGYFIGKSRFEENYLVFQTINNVYDFSVDYDATDVDDLKGIHKYLMKKSNIV